MSLVIDAIDRLIDDTLAQTREIPILDDKYLVNAAIGFRLRVLKEARDAAVKAEIQRLEAEHDNTERGTQPTSNIPDWDVWVNKGLRGLSLAFSLLDEGKAGTGDHR